jgi:hypothetical protein
MSRGGSIHAQTTETFQHVTGENPATSSPSRWKRILTIAFWATTFIVVFELVAGSGINLRIGLNKRLTDD